MFVTVLFYPHANGEAMLGASGSLEGCAERLATFSRNNLGDSRASGYIFNAHTRLVVADFNGGISAVNFEPWIFCTGCLGRRVPAFTGCAMCLACLSRVNGEPETAETEVTK